MALASEPPTATPPTGKSAAAASATLVDPAVRTIREERFGLVIYTPIFITIIVTNAMGDYRPFLAEVAQPRRNPRGAGSCE
jgi:hypothetical protein